MLVNDFPRFCLFIDTSIEQKVCLLTGKVHYTYIIELTVASDLSSYTSRQTGIDCLPHFSFVYEFSVEILVKDGITDPGSKGNTPRPYQVGLQSTLGCQRKSHSRKRQVLRRFRHGSVHIFRESHTYPLAPKCCHLLRHPSRSCTTRRSQPGINTILSKGI